MQPDENFWKKCEGEQIANAYELEQLLGCGAFGGVFRAVQIANGRRLNKRVAVKLMLSGTIQQEELNFALDLPSHQNLVQHFTGNNVEIRGFPMFYLVMELADCSLADFVKKRGGRISSVEAKAIVRDIAQGLKYLHELDAGNSQDKRYVHRDLKLLNVLQVGGVWKIADFGLSKALDRGTMQASKIAGTPYYMPPELFRNSDVSTKWDVWSLGVMIVEMLTGHFPFEAVYQDELERKIQRENPNLQGVSGEWLDIAKGCLVRDHGRRWEADQVLSAINKLDTQSPISQVRASLAGQMSQQETQRISIPSRINNHWFMALTLGVIVGGISFWLTSKPPTPSTISPSTERVQPVDSNLFSFNNPLVMALAVGAVVGGISFWQTAVLLVLRGEVKSALGDKEGVIADLNEAIRIKPDFAYAYIRRGISRSVLGDKEGAITDYNEAIRLKPDYANAYNYRGVAKSALGDKEGAIIDYNEAIRLKPDYANAYNNRGVAKSALGDKEGVIADLNEAIRLKPDYANAYNNRGVAKFELGDKEGEIADYNEAIRLKPDYAEPYNSRGVAKYQLGDKQGSIADYNEAIRLKPDYAEPYYGRGLSKFDLGDKQGSITDYNEAIRLKPDFANAYYSRGLIKKERGEQQEALADFRKAAELYQQQGNTEWYNKSLDRIKELGG